MGLEKFIKKGLLFLLDSVFGDVFLVPVVVTYSSAFSISTRAAFLLDFVVCRIATSSAANM